MLDNLRSCAAKGLLQIKSIRLSIGSVHARPPSVYPIAEVKPAVKSRDGLR